MRRHLSVYGSVVNFGGAVLMGRDVRLEEASGGHSEGPPRLPQHYAHRHPVPNPDR